MRVFTVLDVVVATVATFVTVFVGWFVYLTARLILRRRAEGGLP
jgi:hypothetical protein